MISSDNRRIIKFYKKAQLWLGFFVLFIFLIGCKKQNQVFTITGNTMGTTYSIKIVDNLLQDIELIIIKTNIDSVLQEVNQQMSTYIMDSEISRFNRFVSNDWFSVSTDFYDVIVAAQEISRLTSGAFDITVGPIVDLWGFSGDLTQTTWQPPSSKEVEKVLQSIGFRNITVGKNSIKKGNPDIKIDLNAIAKGYGVDVVFELLQSLGYTDILVEIGGEVRCAGLNGESEYWKIGIDKPILDVLPGMELQTIISLDNQALATSGDYRNYFEYNGEIFSHMIDPIIGYPTKNNVASVSVTAPNCMTADALATALMVMGLDGIKLINLMEEVEAMLLIRTDNNELTSVESFGWRKN
jgi:thiamine biosynthesis lipoprotein